MQKRERNEQIKELLKKGKTLEEVGKIFGITRQRVQQIARGGGGFLYQKCTDTENAAKKHLEKHGYEVYKNGIYLPDFTCIDKEGNVFFVEVKSHTWRMTKAQKIFFEKMHKSGYRINLMKIDRIGGRSHEPVGDYWSGVIEDNGKRFKHITFSYELHMDINNLPVDKLLDKYLTKEHNQNIQT